VVVVVIEVDVAVVVIEMGDAVVGSGCTDFPLLHALVATAALRSRHAAAPRRLQVVRCSNTKLPRLVTWGQGGQSRA
jgi:hypothetical protein